MDTAQQRGGWNIWEAGRRTRRLTRRGPEPVRCLTHGRRTLLHAGSATKRLIDIVFAGALLLAAAPVLALVAIAVWSTSPGPVLFRQARVGLNGKLFSMMKFRTMYVSDPAGGPLRQTERGDPRVTPLGRFLRGHSLDELPQLLNVLQGTMSMVGPRPHARSMTMNGSELDYWVPNYAQRHAVKPGITGLAQINGSRGNVETLEQLRGRVAFDLEYISRWSIWLDVSIIAATFRCVLHDKQAF